MMFVVHHFKRDEMIQYMQQLHIIVSDEAQLECW